MLCTIYKSHKKPGAFLYLAKRDDFSVLPAGLLEQFGIPQLLLMLKLDTNKSLAQVDVEKVMDALIDKGFYLQLPPPQENLLEQNKMLLKRWQKGSLS